MHQRFSMPLFRFLGQLPAIRPYLHWTCKCYRWCSVSVDWDSYCRWMKLPICMREYWIFAHCRDHHDPYVLSDSCQWNRASWAARLKIDAQKIQNLDPRWCEFDAIFVPFPFPAGVKMRVGWFAVGWDSLVRISVMERSACSTASYTNGQVNKPLTWSSFKFTIDIFFFFEFTFWHEYVWYHCVCLRTKHQLRNVQMNFVIL